MRHWWSRSSAAAGHVADRPALWLPGALAWTVTVGWLPLVIGVGRPPTTAELTFLGAGVFLSGTWPWNAVLVGAVLLAVAAVGFVLASAGEAVLLRGGQATGRDVTRLFVLGIVCAAPVVAGLLALVVATALVAPAEFNAPRERSDPLVRTVAALSPIIVATVVAAAAGAALHAASARHALSGASIEAALHAGPRSLRRAGTSAIAQAAALMLVRLGYLAVAAALLRVLWAPIGERLAVAGIDPAVALLLVGFVAIWLCLVLGGGALHAWGSTSWTCILGTRIGDEGESRERMETSTGP